MSILDSTVIVKGNNGSNVSISIQGRFNIMGACCGIVEYRSAYIICPTHRSDLSPEEALNLWDKYIVAKTVALNRKMVMVTSGYDLLAKKDKLSAENPWGIGLASLIQKHPKWGNSPGAKNPQHSNNSEVRVGYRVISEEEFVGIRQQIEREQQEEIAKLTEQNKLYMTIPGGYGA